MSNDLPPRGVQNNLGETKAESGPTGPTGPRGFSRRQTLLAGAGLLAAAGLPAGILPAAAGSRPVGPAADLHSSATLQGNYTIQQQSNNRFVDAHEIASQDFRLVTRPTQGQQQPAVALHVRGYRLHHPAGQQRALCRRP